MERKDIINAVNACTHFECGICPYQIYDDPHYKLRCIHRLMEDINSLFQPKKLNIESGEYGKEYLCPTCENTLYNIQKNCPYCGQSIKKEED